MTANDINQFLAKKITELEKIRNLIDLQYGMIKVLRAQITTLFIGYILLIFIFIIILIFI